MARFGNNPTNYGQGWGNYGGQSSGFNTGWGGFSPGTAARNAGTNRLGPAMGTMDQAFASGPAPTPTPGRVAVWGRTPLPQNTPGTNTQEQPSPSGIPGGIPSDIFRQPDNDIFQGGSSGFMSGSANPQWQQEFINQADQRRAGQLGLDPGQINVSNASGPQSLDMASLWNRAAGGIQGPSGGSTGFNPSTYGGSSQSAGPQISGQQSFRPTDEMYDLAQQSMQPAISRMTVDGFGNPMNGAGGSLPYGNDIGRVDPATGQVSFGGNTAAPTGGIMGYGNGPGRDDAEQFATSPLMGLMGFGNGPGASGPQPQPGLMGFGNSGFMSGASAPQWQQDFIEAANRQRAGQLGLDPSQINNSNMGAAQPQAAALRNQPMGAPGQPPAIDPAVLAGQQQREQELERYLQSLSDQQAQQRGQGAAYDPAGTEQGEQAAYDAAQEERRVQQIRDQHQRLLSQQYGEAFDADWAALNQGQQGSQAGGGGFGGGLLDYLLNPGGNSGGGFSYQSPLGDNFLDQFLDRGFLQDFFPGGTSMGGGGSPAPTGGSVQNPLPMTAASGGGGGGGGLISDDISALPPHLQELFGGGDAPAGPGLPTDDFGAIGWTVDSGGNRVPFNPGGGDGTAPGQNGLIPAVGVGDDWGDLDFSNMFDFSWLEEQWNQFPELNTTNIGVAPILGTQAQEQLINQATNANIRDSQSAQRDAMERMGARGFGTNSPLLEAFNQRNDLNTLMANTQARTNVPIDVARMNAEHMLNAQVANNQALLGQSQARSAYANSLASIARARTDTFSPILQAFMQLMG